MKVKYNTIGIDYNATRNADLYLTKKLLEYLQPEKKRIYLDIGCGTGNYTNEFQKNGFDFIGIDPSELMLEKAMKLQKVIWLFGYYVICL